MQIVKSRDDLMTQTNSHSTSGCIEEWSDIVVRAVNGSCIVATAGREVIVRYRDHDRFEPLTLIPGGEVSRATLGFRHIVGLARRGVRAFLHLPNSSFLVVHDRILFYWRPGYSRPREVGRIRIGSGPLLQGLCADECGSIYYGEYCGSRRRRDVYIWCWHPNCDRWRVFYKFAAGAVRHIHSLQFDPYSKKLWFTSGDLDEESFIGYFDGPLDAPRPVIVVAKGQTTRAVSLMFTPDDVYWGTDCGRDTAVPVNCIYKWSRRVRHTEKLAEVGGPVYYSLVDSRGWLYCTTAVEGSLSESDAYARVWMSKNGTDWFELLRLQKDRYPAFFGYGVLAFPQGAPPDSKIYVTGQGVRGAPATWVLEV